MGCVHSFFEQAVVMKKKILRSQKHKLVEDIDYSEIDNETYQHLYLFYNYYCPSKLRNPFFLYILLNTYQYQLFTLWNQLEHKYGPLQPCLEDKSPYLIHMENRITHLYKKYNKSKLANNYFVSNLLNQYIEQEHILIGKILQIYSGTEDLYSIITTPPEIPPRPTTTNNKMVKYTKPQEPKQQRPQTTTSIAIIKAAEAALLAAADAKQFSLNALIAPEMYCIDELRNHIPINDIDSEKASMQSDDWDYISGNSEDSEESEEFTSQSFHSCSV